MSLIKPFKINVPQSDLDDLQTRLTHTRWTNEIPSSGSEYGVSLERVKKLVAYWRNGYDWRVWEAKLNAYPQFTTEIDGQNIHFLHIKSPEPGALPLIATHGWPGSIVEYLDVIGPLTDPRSHGGNPADAFDLVIPSLPGFGFSGPTTERGWGIQRTAKAWVELMRRLGYERYGAIGNDGGSMISPEMGRLDPEHMVGAHVTQIFSFPSGDPAEMEGMTEDELAAMEVLKWFWDNLGAFNILHSQQPQTLAHAISDSPAGLLAWNSQLLGDDLDNDFVLTNIAIYWFTGTAGSSIRFYREHARAEPPTEPTTIPIGLAAAATGDFKSIRRFAERDHKNIISWNILDASGHYLAHQAPNLLSSDVQKFFRNLRPKDKNN